MLLVNSIEEFPVQLFLFLPQREKKEILSSISYAFWWYMLTFTLQSPKPRSFLLNFTEIRWLWKLFAFSPETYVNHRWPNLLSSHQSQFWL